MLLLSQISLKSFVESDIIIPSKIFLVLGASGIGKSSLCRSWCRDPKSNRTRAKPPPENAAQIDIRIPSASADLCQKKTIEEILQQLCSQIDICVIDLGPMVYGRWLRFSENNPNFEVLVLIENKETHISRLMTRKPDRTTKSVERCLSQQDFFIKKAIDKKWKVGNQKELADYINSHI